MYSTEQKNDVPTFAPVAIPTLCRFDHFKQCIESLSRCTWADKTEVFIALDYPSKEQHWEGYNKIKNFLKTESFCFKKTHIIIREKNYGVNGQNSNVLVLRKQIFEKFDRVIATEDDNIFSPNFLVYINRGLEKFKDDKSVLAINGYCSYHIIRKKDNTFFRQNVDFSAWGFGIWRDRYNSLPACDYFVKNFSLKKFFHIKKDIGRNRALNYWSYYFRPFDAWYDNPMAIYAYLTGMNVIMPSKETLVRNIGWDGSGINCTGPEDLMKKHLCQRISEENDFEFIGTGYEFYNENRAIYRDSSYAQVSKTFFWIKSIKWLIKYVLFRLSKKPLT